jgi:hypothetical protein
MGLCGRQAETEMNSKPVRRILFTEIKFDSKEMEIEGKTNWYVKVLCDSPARPDDSLAINLTWYYRSFGQAPLPPSLLLQREGAGRE